MPEFKESGGFKMRSGNATPFKKMGSYSKGAKNLLKAVPDKAAYDKLSDTNKKGFDKAAKEAGLPTKKSPAKQRVIKGGEGQDQNKIFNNKGQHVGNWVNGKKVMLSTKSKHGQLSDARKDFDRDIKLAQAKAKPKTKKK